MLRIFRFIIISMIILGFKSANADSVIYCDHPADIFYSPITSKIYLACAGDFTTLDLITIDPITLTEEHNFYIGGIAKSIIPTDGGVNLLLLLSNVDGDTSSNDGVLRKVNASNGVPVVGYEIEFNDLPLTMVADSTQTYLYVVWGGLDIEPATINRIRISDFHVMPEVAHYGYTPDSIALTNNNEKLYIKDKMINRVQQPSPIKYYFNIGVFNVADMSMICEIPMNNIIPWSLQMGYDNRLFVSHASPAHEEIGNEISLVVIDTGSDSIIHSISLGENGIGDMDIDPMTHKLYGAVGPRDYYHAELEEYIWRSSEIIVELDLNEITFIPPIYHILDNEGLWVIAVAPIPGCSRLFAIAEVSSEYVHYMDLN